MKHFKKRTIALVLASVVTVVGAFGAENYKNSLMSLKFESSNSSAVNMTLLTQRDYSQTISPVKKDATTYVIMLPETNSKMSVQPELAGNVESVDVRTMPYTTNSKGYTKITIKTLPNTALNAQKALYIPDKSTSADTALPAEETTPAPQARMDQETPVPSRVTRRNDSIRSSSGVDQTNPVDIRESVHQFESSRPRTTKPAVRPKIVKLPDPSQDSSQNVSQNPPAQATPVENQVEDYNSSTNSSEILLLVLGIILVIITCAYLFVKGKNKMTEILGEQLEIDISDDLVNKNKAKEKEKEKKKKIKTTIKHLDKMYTKPVKMPLESISSPVKEDLQEKSAADIKEEANLIVDLDELFQEKAKQETEETIPEDDEENIALEDFLSSFSFTNEDEEEAVTEENLYNEELFNKFINDENLRFSKSDNEKIDKLLNSEISDDTLKNISQFAVTNPVEKKPSRTEILENFVTAYTINQNVSFSKDDVDALYKLISVEIDKDFITDLRTNPHRLEEMQKEFEKQKAKPHKTSELLTLNVKDMLPDLSEALKKQGGRRIESEVKPQVVYYSEGYDVSTISLKDQLPDLSVEINNADAYKSRPSDEIQLAESGYDVAKMSVSNELPDLEDMLKNPEQYDTPKQEAFQADEETLLKNITNVTFKPFYDGSEEFEVINEFDEANAPTVSDMQEEFSQFDEGFEIIRDEEEIPQEEEREINDFESLYDNTYVDFDKGFRETPEISEEPAQEEQPLPVINRTKPSVKPERNADADKLLEFIEGKRKERQAQIEKNEQSGKNIELSQKMSELKEQEDESIPASPTPVCIINDEKYNIIDTVEFTRKTGCYLAEKSGEFYILGYTVAAVQILKHYNDLKTRKIQARASERFDNGITRYIVRVGAHKFILNAGLNSIEYVMDLC